LKEKKVQNTNEKKNTKKISLETICINSYRLSKFYIC
jgi:hypothetical protein